MPINYGNPEREGNLITKFPGGNTPQTGGNYGLASSIAGQYGRQADRFGNRVIGNEYSGQDAAVEAQARAQQMQALEAQRQIAMGLQPSVAETQYRAGLVAAQGGQTAQAASTLGGPSAMVAAQRAAQFGNATMGVQGQNDAAAIRANEMAAARDRYAQGLAGLRGQDQGMQGIAQGRELTQAGMNDQGLLQSQGMAGQMLGGQLNADSAAFAAREMGSNAHAMQDAAAKAARDKQMAQAALAAGAGMAAMAL